MILKSPEVSLVIPTHNRSELLEKLLLALLQQTIPPEDFEIVVVADGCTDNTVEIVELFKENLQIHLIEQPAQGQASARNVGASKSVGKLLVFLDDDIEPQPQFLEAHVRAHSENKRIVVIGYYPPLLETQTGYLRTELRSWWESAFQKMRQPGHRFNYSDFVSGNFSISAKIFNEVGGFNPIYRVHEDYELGIRLLLAGVEFIHSVEAAGYHHERSDINRAFKRKYDEGVADVQLGMQHPSLRSTLLMSELHKYSLLPSQLLKLLAFYWPALGDFMARFLESQMEFIERIRWNGLWRRVLYGLMGYWYWRGVSTELSGFLKVRNFLNNPAARSEAISVLDVNLANGIARSESLLDEFQPDRVQLRINETKLGWIPYQPGSEPLRGRHLRPFLIHHLNIELVKALAEEPDFPFPEVAPVLAIRCEELLKNKKSVQQTDQ